MPELQEEREAREEKKDLTEFKETEPVQKSGWVLVLSLEEIQNICRLGPYLIHDYLIKDLVEKYRSSTGSG